jgi:nucleotide-binding universal stress UspA family protein
VAAVDLLDGSRNVVELARRARGPHAAPLTLVHVLRTPFDTWLRSIDEELARDAGERMESLSASLRDSTVSTRVRRGEARREILAEARNADLIVIGTRGRTALGAAILGGLSQDLAAVASCEVMIAPAQRRSFGAA